MENAKKTTRWNDRLEHVALDIGESSKAFKIMHIEVAQRSARYYSIYMIIGIVIGPLAGVISGIGVAVEDDTAIFSIIATILSFLSGIVVAIIKFNKFDEVITTNKSAAAKYTSLESNVRRQLAVYRNDRIDAGPYIEWLDTSYENLFSSAPLLPMYVQTNYIEKAKKSNEYIPSIYLGGIEINTEYSEQSPIKNTSRITVERRETAAGDLLTKNTAKYQTIPEYTNSPVATTLYAEEQNIDNVSNTSTSPDSPEPSVSSVSISRSAKSPKRGKEITLPELSQFGDGQMAYQMGRMMGFK